MDSPSLQLYLGDTVITDGLPKRGVSWVLRWAAAIAVLAFTMVIIAAFGFQLAAESALRRAANAGLREAALPRSTSESVAVVVRQRLSAHPRLQRALHLQLAAHGSPVHGLIHAEQDERLSLSLTVPTSAAMPRWLRLFAGDSALRVQANRSLENH